ncbi:MAG TPA: sigma-70 family RNA polymerase sigma factor [Gaiellaceae bacterium]|nr:sigma-70 family RNA polymerase sigma factor [Gaiellaceae bacterium]
MATSAPRPEPFPHASRPSAGAARARSAALYERYARTVRGLCRALLRDHAEAEDATQQVFLSAHRALLNGSEPREPAAWLATIARNECWSRISARMREPLPTNVETNSALPDPLAEAIRRADLAALWRAIRELPSQQREALLLREFGGLSYDELAVALSVSTPAVESLLFRARRGLRTKLRTAYAALSGVSWIDALLRLVSGSGAAAPIAVKAVALGVGTAAITSGAIVAPHVVRPHRAPVRHVFVVSHPHTAFTPSTITVSKPVDGHDSPDLERGDMSSQVSAVTQSEGDSGQHSGDRGDGPDGTSGPGTGG